MAETALDPSLRPDRRLTVDDLVALMDVPAGPCVSIHMQTTRLPHEADQNRIRFKNAVQQAERSLAEREDGGADSDALLAPLRELAEREEFFSGMRDGLSVFRSAERLIVRRLPFDVADFTVVADSFHVKPFVRPVLAALPVRVLCVSADQVALFEGDRHELEEVELHPDVPKDMGEALGGPDHVVKTKRDMRQPEDSDQRDDQLRRYFRRLDDAIAQHHAPHGSGVPLMLAALGEYHGIFHEASHNPNLIEEGVKRDPFAGRGLDPRELAELVGEALAPVRERPRAEFNERYGEAKAHDRGSDDLDEVARRAVWGKVDSVAIREDFHVGGTVDLGTGEVTRKPLEHPAIDDLTDDIAEATLKHRGHVHVLTEDEMPTETGVAAIFRQ